MSCKREANRTHSLRQQQQCGMSSFFRTPSVQRGNTADLALILNSKEEEENNKFLLKNLKFPDLESPISLPRNTRDSTGFFVSLYDFLLLYWNQALLLSCSSNTHDLLFSSLILSFLCLLSNLSLSLSCWSISCFFFRRGVCASSSSDALSKRRKQGSSCYVSTASTRQAAS